MTQPAPPEAGTSTGICDAFMPHHPLMAQAWVDCLRWAVTKSDIIAAFQKTTGLQWTPARTPLARLIDQATGHDEDVVRQFLGWFNTHVWGSTPDGRPVNIVGQWETTT